MTKHHSPQHDWEQALIDAYSDHYWRQVLQPLYDDFQRWQAGALTHAELHEAIKRTHQQSQKVYDLFMHSRESLVGIIQFDDEWLLAWLKEHPRPETKR